MGRTSLLMVMGFNIIFATMGYTISNVAEWGYKNYVGYYSRSVAREIAESATNMALNRIDMYPNWRDGYSNVSFMGGTYSVSFLNADSGRFRVNVISSYDSVTYTDTLLMGLRKFSEFAYFSNIEGSINWASGDTIWGPFHTQDKMTINGHPVFEGYVTAKKGYQKANSSSSPVFLGGYKSGVDIPLPTSFSNLVTVAQSGGGYFSNKDVYIRFNANGTATYSLNSWAGTPTTVPISSLAPNGVLAVNNGNLHLKGVLNGQLTVSAVEGSNSAAGNVYFDSSVVYNNDPLMNPNSTDLLGVVCDNNAYVSDNTNNNNPTYGVTIEASILSRTGGLTAQNYNSRPVSGTLKLVGGIQQYQRGAVGTLNSSGGIATGFNKSYHYDDRLRIISPPQYPTTGSFQVLSWYEGVISSDWFWKNL
jgi:hypothetical protein